MNALDSLAEWGISFFRHAGFFILAVLGGAGLLDLIGLL